MRLYYERARGRGEYYPFERLSANIEYHEDFTFEDQVNNIVSDEKLYTPFLQKEVARFGYQIDVHKPYMVGIGATAIAYLVSDRDGNPVIVKFIWGLGRHDSYAAEIRSVARLIDLDMQEWIPEYYQTYSTFNSSIVKGGYCLIFEEYTGVTLTEFLTTSTPKKNKVILDQLRKLRHDMINNEVVNLDFREDNLTVDHNMQLKMIDLSDIADMNSETLGRFEDLYKRVGSML